MNSRKLIGLISSFGLILVLAVIPVISACTPDEVVTPPPAEEIVPPPEEVVTPPVTPSVTPPPTTGPTGELIFLMGSFASEIWGLDVGGTEDRTFLAITNELLVANPIEGQESVYQPILAERWEMSEDGLTWDFYLRQGIQFNEGWGEFTAEDVLFTFQEVGKPGSTNGLAAAFRIGDGGEMASYEVVDRYHFRMNLAEVTTRMEWMLTSSGNCVVVSKKYYDTVGYDYAIEHPIGSGPWRLIEHKPAEYVKYEAVENHWRQTPEFKYLTLKLVPEETTRLAMLKTGVADVSVIGPENKAELEAAGIGIHFKSRPGAAVADATFGGNVLPTREGYDPTVPWVMHQDEPWNANKLPVSQLSEWNQRALKVRQAMFLAIDADAIIEKIFYGEAVREPIYAWQPFGSIAVRPEWEPFPYDPERAKELLVEAGYPDGFEFTMNLFTHSRQPRLVEVAEAVSMYWEAIGLTVNRNMTEYAVMRPVWYGRNSAWQTQLKPSPPRIEPVIQKKFMFHTESAGSDGHESYDLDELLDVITTTLDYDERLEASLKMGDYFYDNWISPGIAISNTVFALSAKVKDFPTTISPFDFRANENFEYATKAE